VLSSRVTFTIKHFFMITLRKPRIASARTSTSKTLSSIRELRVKRKAWLSRFQESIQQINDDDDNLSPSLVYC